MFETVTNLYNSQDLPGEFLLTPLKTYQKYFVIKVQAGSNLEKVAWRVAQIATGIFAYPILGSLAFIGMLVKLCGIPSLRAHNRNIMETKVNLALTQIYTTEALSSGSIKANVYGKPGIYRAYRVSIIEIEKKPDEPGDVLEKGKEFYRKLIADLIDRCTQQFQRIFLLKTTRRNSTFLTFYTNVSSDQAKNLLEKDLLPENFRDWMSWEELMRPTVA